MTVTQRPGSPLQQTVLVVPGPASKMVPQLPGGKRHGYGRRESAVRGWGNLAHTGLRLPWSARESPMWTWAPRRLSQQQSRRLVTATA